MRALAGVVMLGLAGVGCTTALTEEGFPCAEERPCAVGFFCYDGLCRVGADVPAADVPAADFALIAAGSFQMGSPASDTEADSDEKPPHGVTLSRSFHLQTTEVTQGQWQALMGGSPASFVGCGSECPVEQVTWWSALAYCNALSQQAGLPECYALQGCTGKGADGALDCSSLTFEGLDCPGYRLPTEAEWEYAARAGSTEPRYGALDDIAWYDGNSGDTTHAVAQKQANAWGLYDMLGNVWEWTGDWYGSYSTDSVTDPTGPPGGSYRVYRGGGWSGTGRLVRSADRASVSPGLRLNYLGFRPARSIP